MAKRQVKVRKVIGPDHKRAVVEYTMSNNAQVEVVAPFPLKMGELLFLDDMEVSR